MMIEDDIQNFPLSIDSTRKKLKEMHAKLGNKWTKISRVLGRAENDVKNFAYNFLKNTLQLSLPSKAMKFSPRVERQTKRRKTSLPSSVDTWSIGSTGLGPTRGGSTAYFGHSHGSSLRNLTHSFLLQRYFNQHQSHLNGSGVGGTHGSGGAKPPAIRPTSDNPPLFSVYACAPNREHFLGIVDSKEKAEALLAQLAHINGATSEGTAS